MNNQLITTDQTATSQRRFSQQDIDRLEKTIESAPVPARPMRPIDALNALAPALSNARDKGHSLENLVQLCELQGLHVSERAISRAINAARAAQPAKKKQARRVKHASV